jgi:phenylglyoxylate dehydrogenase beta subunit
MEDYYAKLDKAIAASKSGMAYLHVFSPCPTGWRFPPNQLIEIGRKAVETNLVPLWEYSNETGTLQFTHSVDNPLPVKEFLSLIGKYRHLNQSEIDHIQKTAEQRMEMLLSFEHQNA